MRLEFLVACGVPAAALTCWLTLGSSSGQAPVDDAARVRCASRLSLSLTGRAPSDTLLGAADPQSQVDALLEDDAFVDQFARFINSQLNAEPGETPADDATFFLAQYVLRNHRPWHELFDGAYTIEPVPAADGNPATARVVADPAGLGYFRSRPWMVRYAGNEEQGYRLNAAFRIQQNIIGLDVGAVTSAPGTDISATGRMASGCRGCHYDPYFALDKVAKILSKKTGTDGNITFTPPDEGPQQLLDGRMIANDAELVAALLGSTDHDFRTCRLAFQFLYGRAEANCEGALFDQCVDAYNASGDIRDALRTIAKDPGFCE
ncbi:MAG TPA: hypothetical protein VFQ53_31480 [Kofleriaceae bacterium]|nr:hypothetical protein [Kofleriaceae bacterium]